MEIEARRVFCGQLENQAVTLSSYYLPHNLHITTDSPYREFRNLVATHTVDVYLYSGARPLRTVGVDFVNHHTRNRVGLHRSQALGINLDAMRFPLCLRRKRKEYNCQ